MSYQVLARKWRPRAFRDLVGQEHVVQALVNGLDQDRVHHAFLLTGTRGVGKTTIARILAKCLNCENGVSSTPCGECASCADIDEGRFVDMLEIDAASKTKVDDTRELLETVQYTPTRGRYKVYIIDEVHMLSGHSFNALLKTLEEPPPHVKFVLATTDPQKLPVTILSRCLRFNLSRLLPEQICAYLAQILQEESVDFEEAAVMRIARAADGSMRDALSLLDQVWSLSDGAVSEELVDELFPAAHDELNAELIDAFAANDPAAALAAVDRIFSRGATPDHWCSLMIDQVRDLLILRTCGKDSPLADLPGAMRDRVYDQSQKFDAGALVHMITVLEELRRSVKSSGSGRALVDAAVVRLAEASQYSSIESLLAEVQNKGTGTAGAGAAASSRAAPWRATTKAATICPRCSSARPTTPHSCTSGCSSSAASTSGPEML